MNQASQIMRALLSWRTWVAVFAGFIIVVAALFLYARAAYGIVASPIAGTITGITFCPVEGSIAITTSGVLGVGGGTFVYIPDVSELYAYYQIFRPGANTLGMSVTGSTCRGWSEDGIFDLLSPSGYILTAGTSL